MFDVWKMECDILWQNSDGSVTTARLGQAGFMMCYTLSTRCTIPVMMMMAMATMRRERVRERAGGMRDHDEEPERKPRNSINTRTDGRRADDGRIAHLRLSIVRLGVDRRPGPKVSEPDAR